MKSKKLQEFIAEIQYKNRNPQDSRVLELLKDISTNPERTLTRKTYLYRCRIIKEPNQINKIPGFYGFDAKQSFVPSPMQSKDLRANYRYIPYLYCANHPYTAIMEIRPRINSMCSVATIIVDEDFRLLDFTIQNKPSKMTGTKQNLFADLSCLFSKPITSEDDTLDYIPTQYIAEYAKNLGYDGIMFTSSLTPEINSSSLDRFNVVVFNYAKCSVLKSNVFSITNTYVDCQQIDDDPQKMDIHMPIWDIAY